MERFTLKCSKSKKKKKTKCINLNSTVRDLTHFLHYYTALHKDVLTFRCEYRDKRM